MKKMKQFVIIIVIKQDTSQKIVQIKKLKKRSLHVISVGKTGHILRDFPN